MEQRTGGEHWACSESPWRMEGTYGFLPSTFSVPGSGEEGDVGLDFSPADMAVFQKGIGTE